MLSLIVVADAAGAKVAKSKPTDLTNRIEIELKIKIEEQSSRGERIRTSDTLVPNQVRYQTALRPERISLDSRRTL